MARKRWLAVGVGIPLVAGCAITAVVLSRSTAAPVPGPTATIAAEQLLDRLMSCGEDLECAQEVTSAADMRVLRADAFSDALFARVDRGPTRQIGKSAWCHEVGHAVGSELGFSLNAAGVTDQLAGIDWTDRLSTTDPANCQAGVLHGMLDGWATRGDITDLPGLIDGNCREYGAWPTTGAGRLLSRDLAEVGCIHGLGHAVAGTLVKSGSSDLIPESWKWCSRIDVPSQARNCLSGATMVLLYLEQNTDPESCRTIPGDAGTYCTYLMAYSQQADKATADRCAALEPAVRLACWDGIAARGGMEYVAPERKTIAQWCATMPAMTAGAYEPERCAKAVIVAMRVIDAADVPTAEAACAKAGSLTTACLAGSRSAEQWRYRDGIS